MAPRGIAAAPDEDRSLTAPPVAAIRSDPGGVLLRPFDPPEPSRRVFSLLALTTAHAFRASLSTPGFGNRSLHRQMALSREGISRSVPMARVLSAVSLTALVLALSPVVPFAHAQGSLVSWGIDDFGVVS